MQLNKEKIFMKSNKHCSICGKPIGNKSYQACKTKRNTFLVAHNDCLFKVYN